MSSLKRAYRSLHLRSRRKFLLALPCTILALGALCTFFAEQSTALGRILPHNLAGLTSKHGKQINLTFAERVAYQRVIEEIYWSHRIWPKENSKAKPPLDEVMSQAEIENKVKDYLTNSQLLEQYWQKPITPDQLQAEMDRMAQHTKQPEVLREIFAALGNDPFVIAECLADRKSVV